MRYVIFFFLLIHLNILTAFGQQQEVFAPFISRLKATVEGTTVKLTWKDSEDIDGQYVVYRHTQEIGERNFEKASRIAIVESGTEYYIDHPPNQDTYFYAVLAQQNETLYTLFIPFRNKTITGVSIEKPKSLQDIVANISNISTEVKEDSVVIRFSSSRADRELLVYRSMDPLEEKTDLSEANPIRIIPSSRTSVTDFPIPGIEYYYAVLDSELVKRGKSSFKMGENSTRQGVRIPLGKRVGLPESTVRRTLPLPLYPLSIEVDTGDQLSQVSVSVPEKQTELSPATAKGVNSLLSRISIQEPREPEPMVLQVDKALEKYGGEEYILKSILENSFNTGKWSAAEEELNEFLQTHHSESIEERAHFYRGQVYYFQQKYREAFMDFVLARDGLYSHVNPWLDAIFRKLRD
jgi:hypothetical protein